MVCNERGRYETMVKKNLFGLADGTFLYGNYARDVAIKQGNNPDKLWVIHTPLDHSHHVELRNKLSKSKYI